MRIVGLIFLMILTFTKINGQIPNCDSIYQVTIKMEQNEGFEKHEKQFQYILSLCPDHYDTHSEIIGFYEEFYTSVPIMALLWQNLIDYKSTKAKKNINKINYLFHRYITFDDGGTTVHVPPKFVKDWHADYENNMSPIEAGFIYGGAMDYSNEIKDSNSAEKLLKKIDFLFNKIDGFRKEYHGFYYDFYVDFFLNLRKSEYLKTAMYMIMYRAGEKEIKSWIENNSEKIISFNNWRQDYLQKIKTK